MPMPSLLMELYLTIEQEAHKLVFFLNSLNDHKVPELRATVCKPTCSGALHTRGQVVCCTSHPESLPVVPREELGMQFLKGQSDLAKLVTT